MPLDFAKLRVDPAADIPLYRQIATGLEQAIRDSRAAAGTRLPPARDLARQLHVNLVTVMTAYRHLVKHGWVESRVGSGTYVCARLDDLSRTATPGGPVPGPAPLFPTDVLRRIIDHILDTEGSAAFGYDDPGGYPPLQASIREYLHSAGIEADGSEIVIFSGAQQGLSVIVQALVQRGDWVLVERPTYPGILRLLQRAGAQIAPVDVEPDGLDLKAVRRLLRTRPIRLAYVMPTYQNPTGVCYSDAMKQELAALCAAQSTTLLEDDSLSDLDYGNGRHRPLRAVAPGDAGLYLKSFSRLLMPGFRLGFCLSPAPVAAMLRKAKEETDLFTSGFFQRVLHLFLRHGYLAEHVARLETAERAHFQACLRSAQAILGPAGFALTLPAGGPRLWVGLPRGVDPERFRRAAQQHALPFAAGGDFAVDGATATCLSLTFGGVAPAEWARQLRALARLAGKPSR